MEGYGKLNILENEKPVRYDIGQVLSFCINRIDIFIKTKMFVSHFYDIGIVILYKSD